VRDYGYIITLTSGSRCKTDNILVNYGEGESRFSGIKLADCGDSTHVDSVVEEHVIGATIFRSPEAMLNLIWGPATDIWSLGATVRSLLTILLDASCFANFKKLISLIYGESWHIFKPPGVDPTDSTHASEVIRRHDRFFGPFPLSYTSLADEERLELLTIIT